MLINLLGTAGLGLLTGAVMSDYPACDHWNRFFHWFYSILYF
nr:hypothetical protein [Bacillus pumilus]